MHTHSIFLAALAATAALAAPTKHQVEKRSFQVPVNGRPLLETEKALYNAQVKWGVGLNLSLPSAVTLSLGDLAATISFDLPGLPDPTSLAADTTTSSTSHWFANSTTASPTSSSWSSFRNATSTFSTTSSVAFSSTTPATSSATSSTPTTFAIFTSSSIAKTASTTSSPSASSVTSSSEALPTFITSSPIQNAKPTTKASSSSVPHFSYDPPSSTSGVAASSVVTSADASGTVIASSTIAQVSTSTAAEGSVGASPEADDSAYVSQVTIGGQAFNLDFDTGSSDLWVFSSELPPNESKGHSVFNPANSPTFTNYQGGSWNITYGDFSTAAGTVGWDEVVIGGVAVAHQCVEMANNISASFTNNTASDGLLGLGFSSVNMVQPQQQKTFWENALPSLKQPLFTADLNADASGMYEFGQIDSSKYTGEISYVPVDNSHGYWQFSVSTYAIGGTPLACTTCPDLIADTGTTLILLQHSTLAAYYEQVPGSSYNNKTTIWSYPCESTLPSFSIGIGETVATISGKDLIYSNDGTYCSGALQQSPTEDFSILGDIFFNSYFAVFDGGNLRFGVAPKPKAGRS